MFTQSGAAQRVLRTRRYAQFLRGSARVDPTVARDGCRDTGTRRLVKPRHERVISMGGDPSVSNYGELPRQLADQTVQIIRSSILSMTEGTELTEEQIQEMVEETIQEMQRFLA